jgi:hypothetical protein
VEARTEMVKLIKACMELGILQPEITSAFHGSAAEYLFLNFIASTNWHWF